jgi:hypothetical protein
VVLVDLVTHAAAGAFARSVGTPLLVPLLSLGFKARSVEGDESLGNVIVTSLALTLSAQGAWDLHCLVLGFALETGLVEPVVRVAPLVVPVAVPADPQDMAAPLRVLGVLRGQPRGHWITFALLASTVSLMPG